MESDKSSHFRKQATDLPIIESFPLPDHATLKVALEPGYSIQFDDLPSKFQIRIMDRRSHSPPGIHHDSALDPPDSPDSPRQRWMDDYGSPRWEDQPERVVRLPPSEVRLPPSPSRSREQMREELRGDMNANAEGIVGFRETTCENCNTVGIGGEVIYLRKPSVQYVTTVEGRKGSPMPSSSIQSGFIDCQRPGRNFQRNNVVVDGLDLVEMHPDFTQQAAPKKVPPYDAARYSSPPDSPRSASPGRCSWHREETCPVKAGYRCRENTGYESPQRERAGGSEDVENVRCTFHREQSCPAQAGVRCRNERSISPPVSRSGRKEESRSVSNSSFAGYSCKCRP